MRILTAILASLFATVPAFAHDLWLEPTPDGFQLNYGHATASGHAGATSLTYAPDFAQRAVCWTAGGERESVAIERGFPTFVAADCAALWLEASSGVWTTTVDGTRNVAPDGLSGVVRSWRSVESTKRIDTWHDSLRMPLADGLELVPQENPLDMEPGQKLRLLVTLGGVPVAGANVAYGGEIRGVTGSDGEINLRLREAGLQFITASIRLPAGEPGVNETIYATTLHFELE